MLSKDIALSVRGLSKAYTIAQNQEKHTRLTEAIMSSIKNPLKRADKQTFWALKDVSFDVQRGDVVGIIGRNGAGKSTLLKILSRITEPSAGIVKLYGRVGSLLEVGTGFHPELTGRENIYLNGAILGMRKREIDRQFDAIVDFAEVETFLDTPVKRYSSGMYVRLAFAVAAHLNPEILIVDEVLAVGDASFQKKCLSKMGDISRQDGKTVLFVSHNMAAVQNLCRKCILLTGGRICADADIDTVMQEYLSGRLSEIDHQGRNSLDDRRDRHGEGQVRVTGLTVHNRLGEGVDRVGCGDAVQLQIHYRICDGKPSANVTVALSIRSLQGNFATLLSNEIANDQFILRAPIGWVTCKLPRLPLTPGQYIINVSISRNGMMQDWVQDALVLSVESGDFYGTGRLPASTHTGALFDQDWEVGAEGVATGGASVVELVGSGTF